MAKKPEVKMNTFKRIDEDRVVLEGVMYHTAFSKMIEVKNPDGSKIQSIRIGGTYYYPCKIVDDTKFNNSNLPI